MRFFEDELLSNILHAIAAVPFGFAMIAFIGHVHVPDKIDGDPARKEKGAIVTAIAAPLHHGRPIGLVFLNAGIAGIGNIDVPLMVGSEPPRHIELSHLGAAPGKAELAPRMHAIAFTIESLDAVIAAIGDKHIAIQAGGQAARIIKQAFLRARLAAPSCEKLSLLIEFLNRMVVGIGDVDIPVLVERDARGRFEFTIIDAFPADRHG